MFEILYGRNAVYEALLAKRRRFHYLMLASGVRETDVVTRILAQAKAQGAEIRRVARQHLDPLGGVHHQGVAAQVSPYPYADVDSMFRLARRRQEMPLLLILDCLQDPQNLGTLLRTAEVVGVHGVLLPRRRAAAITPAASNASAGAVEHLLIAQVTNLARTMGELKDRGVWVAGLENLPEARDYRDVDLNGPLALVVGSEGQGLRRLVRERCDLWINLPMRGRIGSLNASVAGSIALYDAWRQRESAQPSSDQDRRTQQDSHL